MQRKRLQWCHLPRGGIPGLAKVEKYPGSVLPWSQLGVASADLQPMLQPPNWGIKGQIFFFSKQWPLFYQVLSYIFIFNYLLLGR